MALQRANVDSISRWVVIVGEDSSRLGALLGLTSLSLVDMLHVTSEGFKISLPMCGSPLWGLFCLPGWTLVLALCFFSLPFLGAFFL
jgi:hypothetical protein